VAVCDENLIGKVFHEGAKTLDLAKYKSFYNGKKANTQEVKDALKYFSSANLVGKESIGLALSLKLISKDDVSYIENVPHVQIYRI